MASAVGWYGPLIDLSRACNHVGDFVQLLVFIHPSTPLQYKLWKEGEVVRNDIHVGDDTRPFFPVSIWHKHLASMAVSGHVVLLQNVKITKYGDVLEGRAIHCSSLLPLIHPYQTLVSKGLDELVAECRVGITVKEKLRKVLEWVKRAGSAFCNIQPHCHEFSRNWKLPEERKSKDCCLLSEVIRLIDSCKAVFYASVGEIFLPFTGTTHDEAEKEKMFISRRLYRTEDSSLATDLICIGCQLCGSPLSVEQGRSMIEKDTFYCSESSNRLHVISFIYRPFMLYVWDESEHVPVIVKNKAAELLFGNIKAERVYSSFRRQQNESKADPKQATQFHANGVSGDSGSCLSAADRSLDLKGKEHLVNDMKFYLLWLILLKALLQQGKNSPLKFEVAVNPILDRENGRFELVSVWLPCFRTKVCSDQCV
ncbi:hypothetical protein TIFTF001_008902 [Ficus carica]|uniref:Uncharacterized protein n=1 Tax=Ficus carica TaxID=3494 RepID=A0AA88D0Y1_FICCA|nr:hypothetical protein TIFTF001_008902 [Ficus carica]